MNSRDHMVAVSARPPADVSVFEPARLDPAAGFTAAPGRSAIRSRVRRAGVLGRRVCRDPRGAVRAALEEMAGLKVVGGFAEMAIRRLRAHQPAVFPLVEVLRVLDATEAAGVPCWLGGGWGVDALAGGQTRVHGDLDLVLDDFEGSIQALSRVLERLGYRQQAAHEPGMWLPQAADFEAFGRRIEVLGVNWGFLTSVTALVEPESAPATLRDAFRVSCLAQGKLGPRTVSCLSPAAQALFHTGYPGRERDRRDRAFLATLGRVPLQSDSGAARTALLIPTFDLDARAGEVWSRMHRASTLPPHVTLLYPFLPLSEVTLEAQLRLAALFASEPPFDYQLTRVGWFERRVAYLEPDPPDRFTALVARLSREFGVLPYEGAFEEIIPHLTLAEGLPFRRLKRAAVRAERHLPQQCHAAEAWLLVESDAAGWQIAGRFPMGGMLEVARQGSSRGEHRRLEGSPSLSAAVRSGATASPVRGGSS